MRLGAAGRLVHWGTNRADAAGLNCWLEATPHGYPLYRRLGFEDVENADLDDVEKVLHAANGISRALH